MEPLLIDTHVHLTAPQFDPDREEVLARARAAGVHAFVNPATTVADAERAVALAARHADVFAAVGIHPHEALSADAEGLAAVERLAARPGVVAVGEIGLDYHYDFAPRPAQLSAFRAQLGLAARADLPVIIHTRESVEETIALVREAVTASPGWRNHPSRPEGRYPGPRGVFHCFAGTVDQAWEVIRLGFLISFPGVITFRNAGLTAGVAAAISPEHLLLETDSPYMTPVPHRGTRNEPMHLPLIAARLAELHGTGVPDILRATALAAHALFGIGESPAPEIVYVIRNSLYVNLTLRCNADCVFCDRAGAAAVKGHSLAISREPSAEEVIAAIGDPLRWDEVVFCGYGEPTIRLEELKQVAAWVRSLGGRTRLNTNGHGSLINHRDIVPELTGLLDAVSISLNSADPAQYGEIMRVDAARFFPAMVEFARAAVAAFPAVTLTIVDLPAVDRERAERFAREEIGAAFHVRPLF